MTSPSLAGTAVYAHVSNYQSCKRQKGGGGRKININKIKLFFVQKKKREIILTPRVHKRYDFV